MNGIVILEEYIDSLRKLSTEDLGELMSALFSADMGEEPNISSCSLIVQVLFPIIQSSIERVKKVSEIRSEVGKLGGRPKNQTESKPKANGNQTESKTEANENQTESPYHTIPYQTIPDQDNKSAKRFTAPSVEDVEAYAEEKGITLDAERFVDYYASKGWKVGTTPMKDWRAAARNWAARDAKEKPKPAPVFNFDQRKVDYDKMLDETIGW